MELALLVSIAVLQLVVAGLLLRRPRARTPWIDVSARDRTGQLPGGTWSVVDGMGAEPVLSTGVLLLEARSTEVWVHEVWVRTDHGWVQLQPGAGDGMFRNALVAGIRLSEMRFWLAPAGRPPDESALCSAAGLLVPAAVLLSRVTPPHTS